MFDIPAITWTLTAVLIICGGYHLLLATRSHQRTERVNRILHALMHLVMAAMLWNVAPSTTLAQILVLTGAALWFFIQAVARPDVRTFCAGSRSRMTFGYHSLMMAGGALMIAMMSHMTTTSGSAVPATGAMPMSHSHHMMGAGGQSASAAGLENPSVLAMALTVFFTAAAAVFVVLLLRRDSAQSRRSVRVEHGIESVGAAAMAMMFAGLAA